MCCELYGWFERGGKSRLKVDELKNILRSARRLFLAKHGAVPNLLTVHKGEYEDWMDNMGIRVEQVDNNLAPRHFTLSKDSPDE